MRLSIEAKLDYTLGPGINTILLQVEAASLRGQSITDARIETSEVIEFTRVPAEELIGERSWIQAEERFAATYTATAEVDRPDVDLRQLQATPLSALAGDVVKYLMPSRYCVPTSFAKIVKDDFGDLAGGALIAALRDWIEAHFDYVPGASDGNTTAADTFLARQGICRDYAHVLIALARSADIPARFASVYAPSVEPPDFHAVTEVYLDGNWHLVDATGMAQASEMAIIGVGRDAADVAFMTIHGSSSMVDQSVSVQRG
jgi:transglutaminase-like putative cysteine protease